MISVMQDELMPWCRPDATITLTAEARQELETVARSRRTPQGLGRRAQIVLLTADGLSPGKIGQELGVSQPTVRAWRQRYVEAGLAGLRNEARPGRPRSLGDQEVADLMQKVLSTRPKNATHWSVRSFGAAHGIGIDSRGRVHADG